MQEDSTADRPKSFTINSHHPPTIVPAIYKALTTCHTHCEAFIYKNLFILPVTFEVDSISPTS